MKRRRIFALICALVVFAVFALRFLSAQSLSLNPANWVFSATIHMTDYAHNNGVAFNFPVEDGTHPRVDYFWSSETKPLSGTITTSFQIATSSPSVVFNYVFEPTNTCSYPAHVRLLLAAKGFNNLSSPNYVNDRWWSNPTAALLVGGSTVTLTVPLTPDQWSNVNGQFGTAQPAGFANALQHPAMLGFSYGGGCFFGHGVNVSGGTAQFFVGGYSIG
jgi:hypothetical protein